jgi:hypothetical protein
MRGVFMVLGFLLAFSPLVSSQVINRRLEAGLNVSAFIYQGDLTPKRVGSYRTLRPGFGLFAATLLSPYLSLRAGVNIGWLNGNDAKYSSPAYRQQRNFAFNSTIIELSAVAVYNIIGSNGDRSQRLTPYVFGGIGFNFLNTSVDYSRFNAEYFSNETRVAEGLAADIAHGPVRRMPVIPLGVGLRYPINSSLSIALETNYRLFFTDYLDGFSKSAGPEYKDHYYSHNVSIIYSFGDNSGGVKCPPVKL